MSAYLCPGAKQPLVPSGAGGGGAPSDVYAGDPLAEQGFIM